MTRRRKHWGWGFEDQQPSPEQVEAAAAGAREHLGFEPADVERPVALDDVELPPPRLEPPASLAHICRTDRYERATHSYGKGYRDLIRAFRGRYDNPTDVVAHPADEADVERVLAWCEEAGAVAIPFGGGTSVVGGVEPRGDRPSVTIDLSALDRVLDVDLTSRAALIQAGATGPRLEDQLRGHELTLRHFPQSFEYSTLGGWIATRAGGHYATLYTHIDDFVESIRAVTPRGLWESRRLPGSGAGPSPDRMLIGSEGILGVITEAWMRVQDMWRRKASASILFESFERGALAVRALAQSGLHPSNCRLLDGDEVGLTGAVRRRDASELRLVRAPRWLQADSSRPALLIVGFESAHHDVEPWFDRAIEMCGDYGGWVESEDAEDRGGNLQGTRSERDDPATPESAWRNAFLQAPYLRDTLIAAGVFVETYETAVTWDRFDHLVGTVRERAREALGSRGLVTCRLTHVYPDGAAPYFTVLAPARRGDELAQWDELKGAVSQMIEAGGGTITHHHAVGREHRPWYDHQRPDPFADALRAAKSAVDPAGILNPGVLVDP